LTPIFSRTIVRSVPPWKSYKPPGKAGFRSEDAMEISEILTQLHCEERTFPRDALEAAVRERDRIVPELLGIVERVADNPRDLEASRDPVALVGSGDRP
jgi:hypothetical protein